MFRLRKRKLAIVALAVAGWIFPTYLPGYGALVGFDAPRDPDWYYSIGYIIEANWFSQAAVFEDTWEGGHGHTGPYFPWRLGQMIPLIFVASVILLTACPPVATPLTIFWFMASMTLATWSIVTHFVPNKPTVSTVLFLALVGYWLISSLVLRRQRRRPATYAQKRAVVALAFYPLWLITLGAMMLVPPFIGAAAYVTCLVILFRGEGTAVAA